MFSINRTSNTDKGSPKKLISYFLQSFKLSWKSSPIIFLFRIFFEILTIISPIIIAYQLKLIVNLFLENKDSQQELIILFLQLIIGIIGIRLLTVFIENLKRMLTDNHNEMINHNIDKKILLKINELDIAFFDSPEYHNEINNVYNDGRALQDLAFMVITVLRSVIQIASCFYILFSVNVWIPFFVIILIIPAVFIDNYALKYRYNWDRSTTLEKRKIAYFKTILNGQSYAKDIRIFHTDDFFFKKYETQWSNWFSIKKKIVKKGTLLSALAQLMPHFAIYSTLFFIGIKIINNELTVGDFTYYNGIISQFVLGVTTFFDSINKASESKQKLYNFSRFMEIPANIQYLGTRKIDKIKSIEFKNIYFKYPNTDKFVLKNLSFKLESNKIVALVGENGAGKSTIFKLILRLYDPDDGVILINGINLKDIDIKNLHSLIGVVFQDYNTYETTLRESVAISSIDNCENDNDIIIACNKADLNLDDKRFKKGIDTYIGKTFDSEGVIFSGGEQQKVAISSAFFKDFSYYIMDEPNSSLDPVAENSLISKLEELSKNCGAFFISHKLSIMNITDEILVLANGEIIEKGHHDYLMTKNGAYKKLYVAQAEKYKL